MSRSERLLALIDALRRRRMPVSGKVLAEETGVSLRTLYRDIASLQAQGATIEGEPGMGYVLKPGFMLPPLMFSEDELEALVLGQRWVARRTYERLGAAAANALARITAVLPPDLREKVESNALLVGQSQARPEEIVDLTVIRRAIRAQQKLAIGYRALDGEQTQRLIWPIALGFFDNARVVVAWCELRQGFRHFRADRILSISETATRYPGGRQALLKTWKQENGIPPQR